MDIRVSFVCLGNICRSPTAEGIMRALVERAGLEARVEVESAGTSAFRVGGIPDPRSAEAARQRGIELQSCCRQFEAIDFARLDYVIAMDHHNLADLLALAPSEAARAKVSLLRSFDPAADGDEVPDPYAGDRGFDRVFDICQAGCIGLLEELRRKLGPA